MTANHPARPAEPPGSGVPEMPGAAADAEPHVQLVWTDRATGVRGYLVIDCLVRGLCSGGLRMRAGCTLEEVRGLATAMTAKEALLFEPGAKYVPMGGAKGGIDCDPYDPRAKGVLRRFLHAVRPYIETVWNMGEDLGLRQCDIDEALAELGVRSSVQAVFPLLDDSEAAQRRLAAGFATQVDGISLADLSGGYGVAEATLAGLDLLGIPAVGARVVVQGFGTMGGATARFLARAGLLVVGIADSRGLVMAPVGLDVERLLSARDAHGAIDRRQLDPWEQQHPGDQWLALDAEVLVPAAVSYAIRLADAHRVRARLVVEAANMPVTADAEQALTRRGVLVIPDVVANSATNAWWWWTLFGDLEPHADEAFAKIGSTMRTRVGEVVAQSRRTGGTPREAAADTAARAAQQMAAVYGQPDEP